MKRKKTKIKHLIIGLFGLLITAAIVSIAAFYYVFNMPNFNHIEDDTYLYIYENDGFEEVLQALQNKAEIRNVANFVYTAKKLKYNQAIKSGRYKLNNGSSNLALVRQLRSGNQDPLQLRFNNIRTKEQLAASLAKQLMVDSLSIITLLNDKDYAQTLGFTDQTIIGMFIPNTYEIFWNISTANLFKRMKQEYDSFWTDNRKAQAAAIPMTENEVITLASIIQEETNKNDEYPIIAGLYINRLKINMPLQACPTVKYALGDFALRRILNKHLTVESPYNTYQHKGLPPGPIRTPAIVCIDAVLNYAKHDYLFMAADASMNGRHAFAKTGAEHMRNARKYQQVLNANGIK